jgi:preprotein translocase subunit SecA
MLSVIIKETETMLNYLEDKKAKLEARKLAKSETYADIDDQVEEYRKILYTERNEYIEQKNMLIDAQVAILDEVIEETKKAVDDSVDEVVDETISEVDEVVDETVYNEQKASEY